MRRVRQTAALRPRLLNLALLESCWQNCWLVSESPLTNKLGARRTVACFLRMAQAVQGASCDSRSHSGAGSLNRVVLVRLSRPEAHHLSAFTPLDDLFRKIKIHIPSRTLDGVASIICL